MSIYLYAFKSLATHESAHPGLWSMRELRVLLLFHGRDVDPFYRRPQEKKNENGTCGGEIRRRERCGIIDQMDARPYTVFCVKLCHESVLLLNPKTVHESGILKKKNKEHHKKRERKLKVSLSVSAFFGRE